MRFSVAILSVLLATGFAMSLAAEDTADAVAPESIVYDAETAFEFFKNMKGAWQGPSRGVEHGGTARLVDVDVSAAGSLVLQTLNPGDEYEMINAFHMDNGDLLLTHYCAAQNAPVMKFEKTERPGEIRFVFNGGTNFDPSVDVHAHEGVFFVRDQDTLDSEFVTWVNGQPQPMIEGTLKRKGDAHATH